MAILCVLPARIASERLPRKPLTLIAGRPLIEWSWRTASRVAAFEDVLVATDAPEIAECVSRFGGRAVMTSPEHPSGTDRVAEVVREDSAGRYDVVVNFQPDEPFLDPAVVESTVEPVRRGACGIATLAVPITSDEELRAASVVKVVRASGGRALYFSRAPIPHRRGPGGGEPVGTGLLRHVGLYVYTREALETWVALPASPLERMEGLEQLRPLEAGLPIQVVVGPPCERGIDEPDDVTRAERLLAARHNHERRTADV